MALWSTELAQHVSHPAELRRSASLPSQLSSIQAVRGSRGEGRDCRADFWAPLDKSAQSLTAAAKQVMFKTMNPTMVNINEAKARFSEYARRVKRGERIILCDRNKPFAELRPLRLTAEGRRPFGLAQGRIRVPEDFNDSDVEIEELFSGAP